MRIFHVLILLSCVVLMLSAVSIKCDYEPARLGLPEVDIEEVAGIEIPDPGNTFTSFDYGPGCVVLGAPALTGGIHCYSLPGYELSWSQFLGTYFHGCSPEAKLQATPYMVRWSPGGKYIYAGVCATETCTPHAIKLVTLDAGTSGIVSEFMTEEYWTLHPVVIDGVDAVITVGPDRVVLRYPESLDVEQAVLVVEQPPAGERDADGYYYGPPPVIGDSVWCDELKTLYWTQPGTGEIGGCTVGARSGSITLDRFIKPVVAEPSALTVMDGKLAVISHKTGELKLLSLTGLDEVRQVASLQYPRIFRVINDYLVITSNTSDDDPDVGDDDFRWFGRVQVLDADGNEVFFRKFQDASIDEVFPLADNRLVIINGGILAYVEETVGGGTSLSATMANGNLWVLDLDTMELTGEELYPEGCIVLNSREESGEFAMVQNIHETFDGPGFQDTIRILRID